MPFRYNYDNNVKLVMIVVSVIIVIIIGNTVSSYIVYNRDINNRLLESEKQLSELKEDLGKCTAGLMEKSDKLSSCELLYKDSQMSLATCENERNSLKKLADSCEKEKGDLSSSLSSSTRDYNELLVSSAIAICCRRGIETANYGVVNNEITCLGNKTIKCVA